MPRSTGLYDELLQRTVLVNATTALNEFEGGVTQEC